MSMFISPLGSEAARGVPARHGLRARFRVHALGSVRSDSQSGEAADRGSDQELHVDAAEGRGVLS